MVAEDFLRDARVRQWLDGVEPAWTLLTFESLRALRQEPAIQTAIRIANDLSADEIAGSAVARNTLILLRQATECGGLPVTATGNLSTQRFQKRNFEAAPPSFIIGVVRRTVDFLLRCGTKQDRPVSIGIKVFAVWLSNISM
jgi:hypothetical protein